MSLRTLAQGSHKKLLFGSQTHFFLRDGSARLEKMKKKMYFLVPKKKFLHMTVQGFRTGLLEKMKILILGVPKIIFYTWRLKASVFTTLWAWLLLCKAGSARARK